MVRNVGHRVLRRLMNSLGPVPAGFWEVLAAVFRVGKRYNVWVVMRSEKIRTDDKMGYSVAYLMWLDSIVLRVDAMANC